MDFIIKILSRALAGAVKGKGKLIAAKADNKCTASYSKLNRIEQHIYRLEHLLQTARDDLATAQECLNTSTDSLRGAHDVQAHYDAHADEVLGFYPSAARKE